VRNTSRGAPKGGGARQVPCWPPFKHTTAGTIFDEHDWMICSELEEFLHIGWANKWIHKRSVFLVPVGKQGLSRGFD